MAGGKVVALGVHRNAVSLIQMKLLGATLPLKKL